MADAKDTKDAARRKAARSPRRPRGPRRPRRRNGPHRAGKDAAPVEAAAVRGRGGPKAPGRKKEAGRTVPFRHLQRAASFNTR